MFFRPSFDSPVRGTATASGVGPRSPCGRRVIATPCRAPRVEHLASLPPICRALRTRETTASSSSADAASSPTFPRPGDASWPRRPLTGFPFLLPGSASVPFLLLGSCPPPGSAASTALDAVASPCGLATTFLGLSLIYRAVSQRRPLSPRRVGRGGPRPFSFLSAPPIQPCVHGRYQGSTVSRAAQSPALRAAGALDGHVDLQPSGRATFWKVAPVSWPGPTD